MSLHPRSHQFESSEAVRAAKRRWRRVFLARRSARRAGRSCPVALPPTIDLPEGGGTVAGYVALPSEVDVTPTLERWLSVGLEVLVPAPSAFADRGRKPPQWVRWGDPSPVVQPLSRPSIILVPGLAFGMDGRRLGRGGGWYDRALASFGARGALVIGVCHEDEVVPAGTIPWEEHDRPVDMIATPSGLIVPTDI